MLTLTDRGREMALEDPDHLLQVQDDIAVGETQVLGCYAVLGDYDFVSIVRALDNDAIARFSLELGVRAGVGGKRAATSIWASSRGRSREICPTARCPADGAPASGLVARHPHSPGSPLYLRVS